MRQLYIVRQKQKGGQWDLSQPHPGNDVDRNGFYT